MLKIIIYNRRDGSDLLNFRTQRNLLIDMESFHLLGNPVSSRREESGLGDITSVNFLSLV